MNGVLKTRNGFAVALFTALALSLFHGSVYADDCPSEDFAQFLPAFSANAETQQRLTAMTVKSLVLKPDGTNGAFEPQTRGDNNSTLAFPLMAPVATDKTEGVEVEAIDDSHFNVVDKRAGNSNIKIFNFSRQACWVLEGVEDWSISEKDLVVASNPRMSEAESFCFQRAEAFRGLGGLEQYRLTGEFFEASLENYLCAAGSGDPQASLNAASLSLSGMASQLETDKVEALFNAAATTLADGAASLSTFYCYGNSTEAEGPCQHPEQAEKELIRAATMGSVDAMNYLGYSFEDGVLVTKDLSRALACYRLAADKGNDTAVRNLNRLKTQSSEGTRASYCY
ncbi:tetratricopeptide repeat protein [Pseudomonas nunensis]|uniref:tetratricopeptide repeat protein n=1 Tax=Pseudomonas nunensis TaxID=2961896 RepID=UPI0025B001F8|nr:tetratricopeptide repeat protein [Pseudomonas nunensis]MDN3218810.1 tetratricopeptide repeat protein [Pseudomonas nunensis]